MPERTILDDLREITANSRDREAAEVNLMRLVRARGAAGAYELAAVAAGEHAMSDDPDHEVGDLQDALSIALHLLTPDLLETFALRMAENVEIDAVLDGAGEDFKNPAACSAVVDEIIGDSEETR